METFEFDLHFLNLFWPNSLALVFHASHSYKSCSFSWEYIFGTTYVDTY